MISGKQLSFMKVDGCIIPGKVPLSIAAVLPFSYGPFQKERSGYYGTASC